MFYFEFDVSVPDEERLRILKERVHVFDAPLYVSDPSKGMHSAAVVKAYIDNINDLAKLNNSPIIKYDEGDLERAAKDMGVLFTDLRKYAADYFRSKDAPQPFYVCMTCKTVIGEVVDDQHQCQCNDEYLIDIVRVVPVEAFGALLVWAKRRKDIEVTNRPDKNIYKGILSDTWDQVIEKLQEAVER